ncbi:MAG TPA: HPr family phosphocarrier protein [Clostridia bacterium]|nr:HPr family phosphocarrier protein [Clostridia bacterium]
MKKVLTVNNKLGLHARAAAKFVEVTNKFDSEIIVSVGNATFDGKSIMGLLSIGIKQGSKIELAISGRDEEEAFQALKKLLEKDLLEI